MKDKEIKEIETTAETLTNNKTEETAQVTEKKAEKENKQRKVSVSYTLKAMANNTIKLEEAKILTEEEVNKLKEIHKKAVERWIGLEMGI